MTAPARARWWARLGVLGVVVLLAGMTFLFVRGPAIWQRQYYELRYRAAIQDAGVRHKVNPYLIAAVIETESNWDAQARSGAGAIGLMQLMPATAKELARRGLVDESKYPVEKLTVPGVNIEYGAAYLRYLVERYHEIETALAAYNAGLAHVDVWSKGGGDIRNKIEFPETRQFVLKVARGRDRYEALYPDAFPEWRKQ